MELEFFKQANFLNEHYKHILLPAQVHFRGSLNSIFLISVSNDKPELGVRCKAKKDIEDFIYKNINKINAKTIPLRPAPEKDLQAYIINYALNNENELPFCANIKLITSELAIQNTEGPKIVFDILGYSESDDQLCVIELKTKRLFTEIINQVKDFEKIIAEKPHFFSALLSIYFPGNKWGLKKEVKKIIVWPPADASPKKSFKKEYDIIEITYHGKYIFTKPKSVSHRNK